MIEPIDKLRGYWFIFSEDSTNFNSAYTIRCKFIGVTNHLRSFLIKLDCVQYMVSKVSQSSYGLFMTTISDLRFEPPSLDKK